MNNDTTSIPTTQLLKAEFSFFASIKRKPDKLRKMTLAKFLRFQRTHPRWGSRVRTFRQAQGSAMGEHFRKDNLPAAKPSGCFTDLGASSLVAHSGILCVDIDVEANPSLATNDGATAIRERLRQDPHVIAFYASTGGKGLAVYVPVLAGADGSMHGACYASAEAYFKSALGLTSDPHCKDVSRNRFVSFDADTWVRSGGAVTPFAPTNSEHRDPVTVTIDNVTCDSISEKESPLLVSSLGLQDGVVLRKEDLRATPPCPSPQCEDVDGEDFSSAPTSAPSIWTPAIDRLYARWLGHVKPEDGIRNAIMVGRIPILLSIVAPVLVERFMERFYNEHREVFADYPFDEFKRQTARQIAACVSSYAENPKIALNAKERAAYTILREWPNRQDTFRICRSLSRARSNVAGVFPLTADHLAQRLGRHRQDAKRQLEYLTAAGVLSIVEKGTQWAKDQLPQRTRYRWALRTTSAPNAN